ncbi:hypothetical protein [Nonomuraea rubra]|uniref:hypothetical protein n=1 Tax=Nonomuraea rubra TaxID=46180 RepID=UPI0031EB3A61
MHVPDQQRAAAVGAEREPVQLGVPPLGQDDGLGSIAYGQQRGPVAPASDTR